MRPTLVFPAASGRACACAGTILKKAGVRLIDHPSPDITHLLLDVPSFGPDGRLRDGGDLGALLRMLPPDVRVAGGNLESPALKGYTCQDFLKDPEYVARNAAITAHCALETAMPLLDTVWPDTPALIIGWGRIGKCLARLLTGLDAPVTVAARKESDRAMLRALGYDALDTAAMGPALPRFRVIFNTVPAPVVSERDAPCTDCVKIDLASRSGIAGADVVWARGLPGKLAPASSGRLIAGTFLRLNKEEIL